MLTERVRGGIWGGWLGRGRSKEVMLSRDPKADEESIQGRAQGRGLLGRGKSRFSYLNLEDEKTYFPPHRTARVK